MNNDTNHSEIQKKPLHWRYIIAAAFLLLIIAALVFISFIREPKSDHAGDKVIREIAASQLNKDINELTDEDFGRITEFSLMKQISAGSGPNGEKLFMYKIIKLHVQVGQGFQAGNAGQILAGYQLNILVKAFFAIAKFL